MQRWSPPVRNEAQLLAEVQKDKKALDTERLLRQLRKVDVPSVEIHSSLQGTFSLAAVGTVTNHFRHRGIKTSLVIHPVPSTVSEGQNTITSIRLADSHTAKLDWPNLAKDPDSFGILRELEDAVLRLRREIEGINDPHVADSRVRTSKAFLESLSAFLDDDGGLGPDQVPDAILQNLKENLLQVNWSSVSTHAQKWADTIIKFIDKLFG
ncbi:MAG: hypothetical protein ABJK36_19215 [Tateyamaria sp.]